MKADKQAYRILGDQPFEEAGDPFGFDAVARELKELILRSRDATPFTIGIEASWGRGKSSLMAQLIRELKAPPTRGKAEPKVKIHEVSFNAWTAEGSDVLEGLIKSVLDAIDDKILRRSMRKQQLIGRMGWVFRWVGKWLKVEDLADEIWEHLSADAHRRNQINDLVRKALEEWRAAWTKGTKGASGDRLLVVAIDDLDRCSPENVLKVFEAVKVYLDAPGVVFIIGYDRDVIADAIQERKTYSTEITGLAYIEKIVQTVFRIPLPNDEQVEELLEGYLEASGTSAIFDEADRRLLIDRNSRNPRRIKRFINRFILDYRLDDTSQDYKPELLIKLLIFEAYFPSYARLFYDFGRKNPLQEFLDFARGRAALQQGKNEDPKVGEVLAFYGLGSVGTAQELLQALQGAVPEVFNSLITDRGFTSLVDTFASIEDQEKLIQRVQRRKELGVTPDPQINSADSQRSGFDESRGPLAEATIIWIDDHPENNESVVDWLVQQGAHVYQAPNGQEAFPLVTSIGPDLIISDVERDGDPYAGFSDAERIRGEARYAGPIVFYTSRISSQSRARVGALRGVITDTEDQLRSQILFSILEPRVPPSQSSSSPA